MSLQYIIDSYNLINHPAFKPVSKSFLNIQHALADFIRINRLTGSKNNSLVLVFDGYPPPEENIPRQNGLLCMFSCTQEADELIKRLVEESTRPKDIVVISDDKQVQLMSRFLHARICSVEEFICGKKSKKFVPKARSEESDFKLSYSKMQKIDAEMKKRWLE